MAYSNFKTTKKSTNNWEATEKEALIKDKRECIFEEHDLDKECVIMACENGIKKLKIKINKLRPKKVPLKLKPKKNFNILGTHGHWPWKLHRAGDFTKNTQKQSIENNIRSRRFNNS